MADIPDQLLARLQPEDASALEQAIDAIGEELAAVYAANVADHREARGDNAILFGMKVWTHAEFRISGRFDEVRVRVLQSNGSYHVSVGPLKIGVYKVGDAVDEDVHQCFPDASATKRSYAVRNAAQLSLFDVEPDSPLPPEARYGLDELLVVHFGNPRGGLVKWYVGAPMADERGVRRWAWIARQDLAATSAVDPKRAHQGVTPFDAQQAEDLVVRPRPREQAS